MTIQCIINSILSHFRRRKQLRKIKQLVKDDKVVIMPCNTVFNANNYTRIQDKIFVFNNLSKGQYDLILRHRSTPLHKNRKLAWATFEISGAAQSQYIAKKLGISLGKTGMLSYVGGGRSRNSLYQSGTSINIYKNTNFAIVQLITASTLDFEIQEIGLISRTNVSANLSEAVITSPVINSQKLTEKLSAILNQDTYLIYANISPNIADGSSIWMSSVSDILAHNYKIILLLKENLRNDVIISNIKNIKNVTLLQPADYSNLNLLDEKMALEIIRAIDDVHPQLRGIFVRGVTAANELISSRQFKYRSISYVTDFYEVKDGKIEISEEKKLSVRNIALQSRLLLIQTKEMKNKIFSLIGYEHDNYAYLPPSLPDQIFQSKLSNTTKKLDVDISEIKIGYAGKIMPNWGVEELLTWVKDFNKANKSLKIKLFIAANKISAPGEQRKPFVAKIHQLISQSGAEHYTTFNREQCINLLKEMDYVWAYRPGFFEDNTLELSTKLLEAIAIQQKVICYPSTIHKNELGEDYPFYVQNQDDFNQIMENTNTVYDLSKIAKHLEIKHSISNVADRIKKLQPFNIKNSQVNEPLICFASHDFKFIDGYISQLKSNGRRVIRDKWEWGQAINLQKTKNNYNDADIIFCEWGLANAAWFSRNNTENKPLYIRVHAQEIRERAQKFGRQIDFNKVTKVIFVSKRIQNEYIKLFRIPIEKTIVIPNFVFDDEFKPIKNFKKSPDKVVLGMVGIVPQLKRLDRAVATLEALLKEGIDAELRIKGHRPENMEMMKVPSRAQEMEYYYNIYKNIEEKGLSNKVIFNGWGNDVALWYQDIDFILSPSDSESFHYALADGVLAGCIPVVWNWNEANIIYPKSWIVSSEEEASQKIISFIKKGFDSNTIINNRKYIVDSFGKENVFKQLNCLLINSKSEV